MFRNNEDVEVVGFTATQVGRDAGLLGRAVEPRPAPLVAHLPPPILTPLRLHPCPSPCHRFLTLVRKGEEMGAWEEEGFGRIS